MKIDTPCKKDTPNAKDYYSGHYQCHGINIQAACDSKCIFISVSVAAPGATNDIVAFQNSKLDIAAHNLPPGNFLIGDNAYVCDEHILTPFSGTQKDVQKNDAYNFYLSQLRIKIEQTFGFMTNKWRILKKPIQTMLSGTGLVLLTITRLHNYCINQGEEVKENNSSPPDGESAFFPTNDINMIDIPGNSCLRDAIVDRILVNGVTRPQRNIIRNRLTS